MAPTDSQDIQISIEHLRGEIRNLSDSFTRQLGALSDKFEMMSDIVKQQASTIRTFEDERQQKLGSKNVIRFLYTMLTAGMAAMAYTLHDLIATFVLPKH